MITWKRANSAPGPEDETDYIGFVGDAPTIYRANCGVVAAQPDMTAIDNLSYSLNDILIIGHADHDSMTGLQQLIGYS